MTPTAAADDAAHAVSYIADRPRACLRLIEATPSDPAEQKALLWMLVEEITGWLPRIWRAAR